MRLHLGWGLGAVLVTVASAGADPGTRLGGRVVDENGRPVVGARVVAIQRTDTASPRGVGRIVASAETGADGRFSLDGGTDPRALTCVATKAGRALDWSQPALTRSTELLFRLGPAASIEGETVDETGAPVAGALVQALLRVGTGVERRMLEPLPGNALGVRTDGRGRFRFDNIPANARVDFDMSAPGHTRALAKGAFLPGRKGLRFVLPPEGRLEGTVVEQGRERPLAGVRLHAISSVTSGMHYAIGTTDDRGRFRFAGLSGGNYDLEILSDAAALPVWIGSRKKVSVESGKTTSGVTVAATSGGILEIVLTDAATGKPVNGPATVAVAPARDLRLGQWGGVGEDGVGRLALAPGPHTVTDLIGPGLERNRDKTPTFTVVAGKTVRGTLSVRSLAAATGAPTVAGTVLDRAGKRVPGSHVRVMSMLGGRRDLVADANGRFSVGAADVGPVFCFLFVRHPDRDAVGLEVLESGQRACTVVLDGPVSIEGQVRNERGRPVPGVDVQARIDASHMGRYDVLATGKTDTGGRYRLAVPPGISYAIQVRAPGHSRAETLVTNTEIALERKKVLAKDIVLRSADRVVRGVVRDAVGDPVPGAVVTATAGEGRAFPVAAITDAKGAFTMERLDASPAISLFVTVPGRGWCGSAHITPASGDVEITVKRSYYD